MRVAEIFESIQGETTQAGRVASFVRLAGCNLRCSYCDTPKAQTGGRRMTLHQVLGALPREPPLVVITGGEPLLQRRSVQALAAQLIRAGAQVILETNGSLPIAGLDRRIVRVVDWKCPGSGSCGSFLLANLRALEPHDEVKFVISQRHDYDWASARVAENRLAERCTVLFAPAFGRLAGRRLARWMLADRSPARLQLQLHKVLDLR
jgi:7-carboxy-7-deazaguanine synthase